MTINEANDKVLEAIAGVGEGTILGLLPVTREDQDYIVQAVRTFAQGNLGHLIECLKRCAPAASAFAVALAPSRAMKNRRFFQSIADEIGINVAPSGSASFSDQFQKSCILLGLPTGTLGAKPNIGPVLYQSGILPHWVDPLCDAVTRTMETTPIADPNSMQHVERIRQSIILRVPPGHHLLLDCMRHELGTQVVRRILQAAIRNDYSSLPPHLSDAFRKGLGPRPPKFLAVPYLSFDSACGMLELVLPKQNGSLLRDESIWDVGGRHYVAGVDRRLCVADLPGSEAAVSLRHLAGEMDDQEFHLSWSFDPAHPFRLFLRRDGRERKGHATHGITTVKPGEYFLLGARGIRVEGIEPASMAHEAAFDWTEIDVTPGARIQTVFDGANHTAVASEDPLITFRCTNSLTASNGERILYGDDLRAEIFFPWNVEAPEIEILVSAPSVPKADISITVNAADSSGDAMARLSERGTDALRALIAALPPGIHPIQIVARGSTRRTSASALFWNGLDYISEARGFVCACPTAGVDLTRCCGLIFEADRIAWSPEFHAPFITLYSTLLGRAFEFPRPGVSIQIQDRNEEWSEILPPGSSIELGHPENRIVRFLSGGFQDWEIRCDATSVCTLGINRPQHTLSLSGLAGQFGEAGRISAHRSEGEAITLFSFFRPLVAHELELVADPALHQHRARFRIGVHGIASLAIRLADLLADPPGPANEKPVLLPIDGATERTTWFDDTLKISVTRDPENASFHVEVTAPFAVVGDRMLALDFVLKTENLDEWVQVRVAEPHGTSNLRLALNPIEWPTPANPWQALLRHAATHYAHTPEVLHPQLGELDLADLARFLARATSLLQFKYPSLVWNHEHNTVRWFQEVPILLAANRFDVCDGSATTWAKAAVHQLEARSRQTNTAVVSQILLASVYQLMRAPGHLFENDGEGIIKESFNASAKIANAPTLAEFARTSDAARSVVVDVYPFFDNFAAVSGGGEPHLRRFQWGRFMADIKRRGDLLARDVPRIDVHSLLSPEHMLHSIRMLNRRTRGLRGIGHEVDPDHPLRGIKQAILRMHQPFENRVNALRGDLSFPGGFGADFLLPGVENAWCGRVAQLVFLISGLGRLTGYGRRPPDWFEAQAQQFIAHDHVGEPGKRAEKRRNALCILLSLAPELYAYFHLLWSVVLKDGDDA